MDIDIIVQTLRKEIIDEGLSDYRSLLETTPSSNDKYWKGILPIYQNLNQRQKQDFCTFIRLIQVNTLSHIFGVIDGSSTLANGELEFKLTVEPAGEIISGQLQDILLQLEEDDERL